MTREFDILDVDAGIRIDKYLSEELPDISRSYIQKLIKEEQITVNGKIVKVNYKVNAGDILRFEEPELKEPDILAEDIPLDIRRVLGDKHGQRINTMVTSIIEASTDKPYITMSEEMNKAMNDLRSFLFETVYLNPIAKSEETKAKALLASLFEYFVKHPEKMPKLYVRNLETDSVERCVCDYISGMTDRYAIDLYNELFIPRVWRGRA